MTQFELHGSARDVLAGARLIGPADPAEMVRVQVILRRRDAEGFSRHLAACVGPEIGRPLLDHATFTHRFGADPEDVAAVKAFAQAHGLAVAATHAGRRMMVLAGTVQACNAAFGVDLRRFEHAGGTYRGRTGSIHLPHALRGRVEAVLGLDNRPTARTHFRYLQKPGAVRTGAAHTPSYTPPQIAQFYDFPAGTGQGTCVAIIELGGGTRPADLQTYFAGLGIAPAPTVVTMTVDGATNAPTTADSADGEVMLDVEIVGGLAPQAAIVVYFGPNTDAGFLDAVSAAIHDTTHKPSVVSISWGGPESSWTQQSLDAFDQAFQDAATLGVTICVASGDGGSQDGVGDGADHVDFPASSPHVLACGGTNIAVSGSSIAQETVWNGGAQGGATGGGVSGVFAVPTWQSGLQATTASGATPLAMRGVPDVSGDADPASGYAVLIDGTEAVIGGTSAVAPLWAGLIARINGGRGTPVGFLNATLYANPAATRDVVQGNNGTFLANTGWDACTGLGSPDGAAVAALFAATS